MEAQRRIAERALYAAARNTHSAATQMRKDYDASSKKDPEAKKEYLAMYGKAIELYRTFISTYGESDYIYEFTSSRAKRCSTPSGTPRRSCSTAGSAITRDMGTAYYLDAARSILPALVAQADMEVAAGTLKPLKIPTVADLQALRSRGSRSRFRRRTLDLQREYDTYQNIVPDPAAAPQQGINAALISLAYLHVDDAIARFHQGRGKLLPHAAAGSA